MYYDGTMDTYLANEIKASEILEKDPYQAWCFGPELLDEKGNSKTHFNTSVASNNPRAAIGYYSPGHYCFVVVDGRDKKHSYGLDMQDLSKLFEDMGCIKAYNLDGGATAVLSTAKGMINQRKNDDRECSDIIYIVDRNPDISMISKMYSHNIGILEDDSQ